MLLFGTQRYRCLVVLAQAAGPCMAAVGTQGCCSCCHTLAVGRPMPSMMAFWVVRCGPAVTQMAWCLVAGAAAALTVLATIAQVWQV